jgi:hypothetical protein
MKNKIKCYLIIGLMLMIGFGCKAQQSSTIIGKWCLAGDQNEPESEIQYYDTKEAYVLEIIDYKIGFSYTRLPPYNTDTSVVITKVTTSKIIGYRKGFPHKRINEIIYEIDKFDSNELILRTISYEGYKSFYKRCE